MALLDVEGVVAGYDGLRILHGVSLAVEAGQIVAVVGPNGAGKSTLLKSVFGLVRPAAGRIRFNGADLTGAPPGDKLRRGMSYVPQGRNIFPLMSVEQNLELGGHILPDRGLVRRALKKVYALFPQLHERRHQRASELSGGLIQLLQVARALLLEPRLILFDEPSLGLSPILVQELFDLITGIHGQGTAILLVEQNAHKALDIADYGYVLELGANRYEGAAAILRADERIKRLYLGGR
jgi:ABC-type branched-subunit amino acid transport system ATPase component